ncbi:hypothetical protein TVAG_395740 [Trichomonas vaginalis G3]|uniref:PH domain-containing protein n=1 Tax=Trichomonas vaginalis (strain ATCC PRA-98 / G3) TaxID=412133 RepID=A2FX50_TRIV3|nr:hypothetical protein TVAGG3_0902410 [Trichomonas vaginalis G3]EAX90528.1 hypothetical protein TVAG_395740 [Trichomonas vaginalis G3]KAI5483791.1 hypothetical protein TVAGG3_0902410 [Trichomonas vaginalis G3]|eukprot:XP_001303458.1 hypothetical protein [Trichomonas vaginalis G3]
MEQVELATPQELFKKYVQSYITKQCDFIVLRNKFSKASALDGLTPNQIHFDDKQKAIVIAPDNKNEAQVLKVATFESLKMDSAKDEGGQIKYINITIKGDKPLILQGQKDSMELWYDGIRSHKNLEPETETSKQKIEIFAKAKKYAEKPFPDSMPNIPAPPANLNFSTKLDIE